jgi:hypothetical protein
MELLDKSVYIQYLKEYKQEFKEVECPKCEKMSRYLGDVKVG